MQSYFVWGYRNYTRRLINKRSRRAKSLEFPSRASTRRNYGLSPTDQSRKSRSLCIKQEKRAYSLEHSSSNYTLFYLPDKISDLRAQKRASNSCCAKKTEYNTPSHRRYSTTSTETGQTHTGEEGRRGREKAREKSENKREANKFLIVSGAILSRDASARLGLLHFLRSRRCNACDLPRSFARACTYIYVRARECAE